MFFPLSQRIRPKSKQKSANFIAYLNNSVFPPLLSEEDEGRHLLALQEGNEESRNILIEHNLRLVAHIGKKFESTGIDREDLISIGTIGLIKGIKTFRRDKGTRLATYVARCIENEILMYIRATKGLKNEVSLYEPVGVDKDGDEVTLLDLLGSTGEDISEVVENKEEKIELMQRMEILEKKERYVLQARYGLVGERRKTQREIAKIMCISRSYV